MVGTQTETEMNALIAAHIELHPANPGIAEYRLKRADNGYPVWSVIGSLAPDGSNLEQVARDFEISREAIAAAWVFYLRHKWEIDARLAAIRAALWPSSSLTRTWPLAWRRYCARQAAWRTPLSVRGATHLHHSGVDGSADTCVLQATGGDRQ